jgi:hypothetical protein
MEGLTSVFGMGTGAAPPAMPPETLISEKKSITLKKQLLQPLFDNRRKKK